MAIRIRACRDLGEFRAAVGAIGHYFGWVPTEENAERFSRLLPVERMHAAFDGSEVVGGAGVLPKELTVPGGLVPCAGVTVVGVLPTHRRRGLEHDEALRVLPRLYDRVRRSRPGFLARTREWWEQRILSEEEHRRRGAGPLNRVLVERGGRPVGYALYRVKRDPGHDEFRGAVRVIEALGVDARATRQVWRYLLEIDWMDEITAGLLPVDHPIVLQVARVNKLGLQLQDGLWLRLVDVGAALSARGYAADARVSLEVTGDPQIADNLGVWTLEDGVVRRSRRRPDVRCDVQALGAAYLGGFSFAELARAELVEEGRRGGLARADALFRSDSAPWCPEIF